MLTIAEMLMYNSLPILFFILGTICFGLGLLELYYKEPGFAIALVILAIFSLSVGGAMMYTADVREISITPCNIVQGGYGYYIADINSTTTYYASPEIALRIHLNKTITVSIIEDISKYPTIVEANGNACLPNVTC